MSPHSKRRPSSPTSPNNKPNPKKPREPPSLTTFTGRNGLGAYILSPQSYPPSLVVYHNEHFVALNDLYPKSSIHILLLPRDPAKTLLHPITALSTDDAFLALVRAEVAKVKKLVASELRRLYGKFSAKEAARSATMDLPNPPDTLPPGRDWDAEILTGIHAGPSMNHLHIHILSVDRYSPCMKHRKHYNSFATPFLIRLEEFPLAEGDPRVGGWLSGRDRESRRQGGTEEPNSKRASYLAHCLKADLECWRCGRNFGNKFARLKEHLGEEFEAWKKE